MYVLRYIKVEMLKDVKNDNIEFGLLHKYM